MVKALLGNFVLSSRNSIRTGINKYYSWLIVFESGCNVGYCFFLTDRVCSIYCNCAQPTFVFGALQYITISKQHLSLVIDGNLTTVLFAVQVMVHEQWSSCSFCRSGLQPALRCPSTASTGRLCRVVFYLCSAFVGCFILIQFQVVSAATS
jgi:hypothetical protein